MGVISSTFVNGVREIREFEKQVSVHSDFFKNNIEKVNNSIQMICEGK